VIVLVIARQLIVKIGQDLPIWWLHAFTLMRSLAKLMDDAVRQQGVQGFTGDGMMAVFGGYLRRRAPASVSRCALRWMRDRSALGGEPYY
jgi:hypothetical protein